MKLSCINFNTNTDEQNANSIRLLKNNFVRMNQTSALTAIGTIKKHLHFRKVGALTLLLFVVSACTNDKPVAIEGKFKREMVSVAPKIPGRIATIFVTESQKVKKGDTLALINIPEVEAKMAQAKGAVYAATYQYTLACNGATAEQRQQIEAGWQAAQDQYEFAQKTINRLQQMYDDSLISAQSFDEAMAKYNGAHAQLSAASARKLEIKNGTRNEQINMAKGQMEQAQGVLQETMVAYAERYITAPCDMQIETIALHEGELALAGYNMFVGYNLHNSYFRFTITESQIKSFTANQNVMVTLPFLNKEIPCKITNLKELAKYATRTSAYPQYQLGENVYELKVIADNSAIQNELYANALAILNLTK